MSGTDLFHLGIKAMIVDPSERILLLKVNLEELSGYEGEAYWDIPGGRLHRGDSIAQTLQREVLEETGIASIGEAELIGSTLSNIRIPVEYGDVGLILFIYRCRMAGRPSIALSKEHVDWAWMTRDAAAQALSVKYPADFTESLMRM